MLKIKSKIMNRISQNKFKNKINNKISKNKKLLLKKIK